MVVEEFAPRPVAQGGGRDDQHALAALLDVLLDDRAADVGLAEPDAIGDDNAVVVAEDALGAPHAVALEARQVDAGVALAAASSSISRP